MPVATVVHHPVPLVPSLLSVPPPYLVSSPFPKLETLRLRFKHRPINFKISAGKKQVPALQSRKEEQGSEELLSLDNEKASEGHDLGWLPAFPHVFLASMSNFLFGYHIG
ncbi:hypothetical protein Pint_01970 [Pistacia integerrima]|uniref:Uncharacterized protein n=1 Tax=Pistacia integerrima TaxID=434235 RepID=A0ACC0ZER6_9ROSI|nr:hypothetical protein Pint_01970 [Pistacia integerrima]